MGVKYYAPGEHPTGFVGFRVTLMFDRDYRQEYFSTANAGAQNDTDPYFRYQYLRAHIQNLEWELESIEYQYQRYVTQSHPATKPFRSVGVHGITLKFFLNKRKSWRAGFNVAQGHEAGQNRTPPKIYTFDTTPYTQAWHNAVDNWAEQHGIRPEDAERVRSQMPEPAQFKQLRHQMNEHEGFDIPLSALTSVFAEQRARLAGERTAQMVAEKAGPETTSREIPEVEEVSQWFSQELQTFQQARRSDRTPSTAVIERAFNEK